MATGTTLPIPQQFFDNNGDPLSGGKIYAYRAGTSTPVAVYSNKELTIAHTWPVELYIAGRADIFFEEAVSVIIKDYAENILSTDDYEPLNSVHLTIDASDVETKSAFNKPFGATSGTVAEGNHTHYEFDNDLNIQGGNALVIDQHPTWGTNDLKIRAHFNQSESYEVVMPIDPGEIGDTLVVTNVSGPVINTSWQVGAGVEDISHSNILNLDSDDHEQYHTDARGDLRYYTKIQADNLLDQKITGDDPRLYDERDPKEHLHFASDITDWDTVSFDHANLTNLDQDHHPLYLTNARG